MKIHCYGVLKYFFLFSMLVGFNQGFSQNMQRGEIRQLSTEDSGRTWISKEMWEKMRVLREYGIKSEALRYRLAFQDITPQILDSIKINKETKLDIVEVEKNFDKAYYDSYAIWFDGIAEGKVLQVSIDPNKNSCYHIKYKIEVTKYLKMPKTIKDSNKIITLFEEAKENKFKKGESYLFFLSNSHLKYYLNTKSRECSDMYREDHFIASENSPQLLGNNKYRFLCPFFSTPEIDTDSLNYTNYVLNKIHPIISLIQP